MRGIAISKKIVVVGPSFGNYVNSIASGFRCNGYEVAELPYIDPPQTLGQRALWRVLPSMGLDGFPRREMAHLLTRIRELCKTADLLLFIKGDRVPLTVFEELTTSIRCPVVLWFMDSVQNVADGIERAKVG